MYHAKLKQYLFALFLLTICAALFSCSKKCGCGPPISFGNAVWGTVKKVNILPWSESTFADTIKNDTVTILSNSTKYVFGIKLKFSLDNSISKLINGAYQKQIDATFYQYGYTGIGTLVYKLDNTANNTFNTYTETSTLTDSKGEWLTGSFNLTFKLATPTGNTAFDTTRVYFPGQFRLKLDK
jgi:hypothetical protein